MSLEFPSPLPPAIPLSPKLGLPAALVHHRSFSWACAGVSLVLVGAHLGGISLWKCPFFELTGLPCPGCGLTRSCGCLFRGDLGQSFHFHLFGPVIFLVGAVGLVGSFLPLPQRFRFAVFLQTWDQKLKFTPILLAGILIYALTRIWLLV